MKNRVEEVLEVLADYDRINVDKFYNDKYNMALIEQFENGETWAIKELYDTLDQFIQFETNYNSNIGDF